MDKEIQQKLQEKYMELQMVDQQMQQFQKQLQSLDEQIMEIAYTKQSLDELNNVEKGRDILVPISSGIFMKAKVEETNDLLVNVGSNTSVKKSLEDTKKLLEKQQEEIAGLHSQINENMQKLGTKAMELEKELEEISKSK